MKIRTGLEHNITETQVKNTRWAEMVTLSPQLDASHTKVRRYELNLKENDRVRDCI